MENYGLTAPIASIIFSRPDTTAAVFAEIAKAPSDHFLEHLGLPLVSAVLRECHRVLRPSGILDFTVPHFDPSISAYLRRDFDLLKETIYDIPKDHEAL